MNPHTKYATNNFDFIRLLAACLVIIGHAYPLLKHPGIPYFLGTPISTYAVKIFFALSGFLIVGSWVHDPNPLRFLSKRVLRIYPALAVVVILAACVLGPIVTKLTLAEYFSSSLFTSYFLNLRLYIVYFLPGVFEENAYPNAVNGSLWSLPAEFMMYLLVLMTGIVVGIIRGTSFSKIWFTLTVVFLALNTTEIQFNSGNLSGRVLYATSVLSIIEVAPYFMIGGCIQLARKWLPLSPVLAIIILTAGAVLSYNGIHLELLFIILTSYSVIAFGSVSTPVLRNFGRWGDLSYGVYLYGFPVAQTLSWAFGSNLPFIAHISLALMFSLAFAFISWHLVEKPALRIKPRSPMSRSEAREPGAPAVK